MASVPLELTARGAIVLGQAPLSLPRGHVVTPACLRAFLVFLLPEAFERPYRVMIRIEIVLLQGALLSTLLTIPKQTF